MKEEPIDIDRMVMSARYLHALDIEYSQGEGSLSDMERKDYIDLISSQRESIDQLKGMVSELRDTIRSLNESLAFRDKQNSDLLARVESLNASLAYANEKLAIRNKERFDRSSRSNRDRKEKSVRKKSREEEKDDYEGPTAQGSSSSKMSGGSEAPVSSDESSLDKSKVSSEHLDGKRGPRGKYTTMDAARVVSHRTSLMAEVPEGWRFIDYKRVDEFTKISYVQCDRFTVAVYEDDFGFRHEYYSPVDPSDEKRPRMNTVPGTHCTPEFLSEIILDNIKFSQPNHRGNDRMVYDGFHVSENTRKNWMRKAFDMMKPLEKALRRELFKVKKVLNIDETWCRVRIKYKGDKTKLGSLEKKYIWVIVNRQTKSVYFLYDNAEDDSRGIRPIREFLSEYTGAIQSDGYVVYRHLARNNPDLSRHLQCWAHVRAKYKDSEVSGDPLASWFVDRIGQLYLIEAECLLKGLSPGEILSRRRKPDVTRILESLRSKAEELLSRSRIRYSESLRRAMAYMLDGWENLVRYREDGSYSIDNNLAERSIRPLTNNRKNSLFYGSERGVAMSVLFHSLVETGKARGLNLKNWFVSLIRELMRGNKDYKGLLQGAYM